MKRNKELSLVYKERYRLAKEVQRAQKYGTEEELNKRLTEQAAFEGQNRKRLFSAQMLITRLE